MQPRGIVEHEMPGRDTDVIEEVEQGRKRFELVFAQHLDVAHREVLAVTRLQPQMAV